MNQDKGQNPQVNKGAPNDPNRPHNPSQQNPAGQPSTKTGQTIPGQKGGQNPGGHGDRGGQPNR